MSAKYDMGTENQKLQIHVHEKVNLPVQDCTLITKIQVCVYRNTKWTRVQK